MIAIIDYQMGNLRSVQKAFERVGQEAQISDDPRMLESADHVVLPGVGAFRDAIAELRRRGWITPILETIESGKPFLGICLGLQLLLDVSYEDGQHEGLGVVSGAVRRFELPRPYKVPHMGWNQAIFRKRPPVLEGLAEGTHFYFVHSFYADPDDKDVVAIEADYGKPFCAAICRDNLLATQFHPEKSQQQGQQLLRNFATQNATAD